MKKRLLFFGWLMFSLHATAHQSGCDDIGIQLSELANSDQKIRQKWESLEQNSKPTVAQMDALQQRWRSIDAGNLKQFKKIIAACGWPKTEEGSHIAWLLAQHADSDLAFQRVARGLLETSVKAGHAAPRDLAYLADRIAANERRP